MNEEKDTSEQIGGIKEAETQKKAKLSRVDLLIYYGNPGFVIFGIACYMLTIFGYILEFPSFMVFALGVPFFYYTWAIGGGIVYGILQGLYGLLQYIRSEDKAYLHHCWGVCICAWAYFVLFILTQSGLYLSA